MGKILSELTISECQKLYKEIIKNSDRRWKSAKVLSDDKDYGGAIRDLITSIEEMIKAIIMLADANGFEFRKIKDMDSIIRRNHTIRHLIGYGMLVLNIFVDDLKNIVVKFRQNPSYYIELKENKFNIESFVKKYILQKVLIIQKEFFWFSKVELIRQQGTHVDLEEDIVSPLDLTDTDYQEVYSRMYNVRYIGKEIIKTLNSDDGEVQNGLSKLRKKFIIQGLYEKIESALETTSKGKKNPFGLIERKVRDLDIDLDDLKE